MTDVLRITRVSNGWFINPGHVGGDLFDMEQPSLIMVATNSEQLLEAVAQWVANHVKVTTDYVNKIDPKNPPMPYQEVEPEQVPIDQIESETETVPIDQKTYDDEDDDEAEKRRKAFEEIEIASEMESRRRADRFLKRIRHKSTTD